LTSNSVPEKFIGGVVGEIGSEKQAKKRIIVVMNTIFLNTIILIF
jgi:hypothetical protein